MLNLSYYDLQTWNVTKWHDELITQIAVKSTN